MKSEIQQPAALQIEATRQVALFVGLTLLKLRLNLFQPTIPVSEEKTQDMKKHYLPRCTTLSASFFYYCFGFFC